jgi:hypothetical protein
MSMIELDPDRYGFMRGVNQLREYLLATRWDFNRRMWVGRSIINGAVAIQPDSYSPAFCLELLRICLTLDAREVESAAKLRVAPRFTLVSIKALVLIDAIWSLQGFHKPFQAMREWHEITEGGKRYDIPNVLEYRRQPMPETRYIPVGKDWDNGEFYGAGLYSTITDIYSEPGWGGGCMGHAKVLGTTKNVTNYFFSDKYTSINEMPTDSVIGVSSMEQVISLSVEHPQVATKIARGKANKMLEKISQGELDAVLIPGKKLSNAQKALAKSIGDAQTDESGDISVLWVNLSDEIDVNLQSAHEVMGFFMKEMLEKNAQASDSSGLTEGYRWWLQMGTISVSASQLRKIDSVMRRTCFKERNGLAGAQYSRADVVQRSISKKEFFAQAVANMPSEEDKRNERLAAMSLRQEKLRGELSQKRVSLNDLYKQWSPEINWKSLVQSKSLPSSRIPRRHVRNGYLVLRHFVSRTKLAEFIGANDSVKAAVQKHRAKKCKTKAVSVSSNDHSFVLGGQKYVQEDLFGGVMLAA